jgi:2-haloacid dehalogenase
MGFAGMNVVPEAVVFDLGDVLIDWNPRHLYRKLFPDDEAAMERFLTDVCSSEWNLAQDAGRTLAEGTALLVAEHPDKAALIEAYYGRWDEMVAGSIQGTVEILARLRAAGVRVLALTNWSAETFVRARRRFAFLDWFEGIVVSGAERMVKPDPRIYRLLAERYRLTPGRSVFIDDLPRNVEAATAAGLIGLRFVGAGKLAEDLRGLGLPA